MTPRRRLARAAAVAAATVLLAGCADTLAARRAQLQRLVGQKLDVLIATEGVPDSSVQRDGVMYLSYAHQRVVLIPPLPTAGPPWTWGWYASPPPTAVLRGCETTFAVKDRVVVSFQMRGNDCG
ncbi:MAG: hypothetical protein KGL52_00485 [Rhodospirillales bacterium]|nr:hypothetical protein [Rhodospirillales bacterium]